MQRYLIILVLFLASCSQLLDKPKDLINEDQMATILVDLAINEQSFTMNSKVSQEEATKYIMKHHKINGDRFIRSYEFYMTDEKKMNTIYDKSKEMILNKDPKSKEFINKKLKELQLETAKQQ